MIISLSHLLRATPIATLALCAALILSNTCDAATVTLGAVGDTFLREGMPNTNYGTDIDLQLRNDLTGSGDRVILIGFDVSSIPSNACILQATLRLYQYDSQYMTDVDWVKVGAYRLLKTADEGTGGYQNGATWYYRHTGGLNEWSQYGARGRSTNPDRHSANNAGIPDSVRTLTYVPSGGPGRWVEWDVTPSAQFWHRNPSKNYGIVLDKWLEGQFSYDDDQIVKFWAREYGDANYRPQLVVDYVIPSAQTPVTLRLSDLHLNYFDADPDITFSQSSSQLLCSGTTSDTSWDPDGCATTYTMNSSFECDIQVKLQQGIVGVARGQFAFEMFQNSSKYIRLQAVGYSTQYYEISGVCTASGNGKYHDGSYYWASYWDDGYPTGPPSSAVRFFSETTENEATSYLTWKLRYDKPNKLFLVYVNGQLVTYYTKVDFSNWRLAITHGNDYSGVPTTVWTYFPDNSPPTPNPMTWATQPTAASTSQISMTATTASDNTPPVQYYFEETSGSPGGTSSGWISNTSYSDSGLSANTQYGYRVKARDSAVPPNEGAYSTTVQRYTHIPAPTGVQASDVQATSVALASQGSFPNLSQGLTGTQFSDVGGGWLGDWRLHETTDTATGLTPNTAYAFKVKSRNGDGIETALSSGQSAVRTLAAQPSQMGYNPVTTQSIRANWGANVNPAGTEYFCREMITGRQSGWITDTFWILTNLPPEQQYQFLVKARNADLKETGWTDLGVIMTTESIGTIKKTMQAGDPVRLTNKVVTAVFDSERLFFVQDWPDITKPLGGAGIAVRYPEAGTYPITEGEIVGIVGNLAYNDTPYNEELIVRSSVIAHAGMAPQILPFGGSGSKLGGAVYGCQPGLYDDVTASPPSLSYGLNTVGRLVKAWGRLLETGSPGVVWIDDGSGLNDGDALGTRVDLGPIGGVWPIPDPGYVSVTGVMRCFVQEPGGHNVRVIWPRRMTDLMAHQ